MKLNCHTEEKEEEEKEKTEDEDHDRIDIERWILSMFHSCDDFDFDLNESCGRVLVCWFRRSCVSVDLNSVGSTFWTRNQASSKSIGSSIVGWIGEYYLLH